MLRDHVVLLESLLIFGKRALFILTSGTIMESSFSGVMAQVEFVEGIVMGLDHHTVSW
jgi:hypothetical protein